MSPPEDYGRQEKSDAENEQGGEDEIRELHASPEPSMALASIT
jgi:hypothetical protein